MATTKKRTVSRNAKPDRRNVYHAAQKIAAVIALETNGGNYALTSVQLCIPEATIRSWATGKRAVYVSQLARVFKGDMQRAFQAVVWQFLGLAMGKAEGAPLNHLMTGAGIAFDKMRLLQGMPTDIHDNRNKNLNMDLSRLSPDQREQLANLIEAATVNTADTDNGNATAIPIGPVEPNDSGNVSDRLPAILEVLIPGSGAQPPG